MFFTYKCGARLTCSEHIDMQQAIITIKINLSNMFEKTLAGGLPK